MVLTRVVGAAARKEGGRGGGRAVLSLGSVEDWARKGEKRTLRLLEDESEEEEEEEEDAASAGEKRICLLLRRVLPVRLRGVLPSPFLLLLLLPSKPSLPEEGDDDDDDGGRGGGGTNKERRPLLLAILSPRCLFLIGRPDVVAIHLLLPALRLPTLPMELAVDTGIKRMESRRRIAASGAVPTARHLDCSAGGIATCSACIVWK